MSDVPGQQGQRRVLRPPLQPGPRRGIRPGQVGRGRGIRGPGACSAGRSAATARPSRNWPVTCWKKDASVRGRSSSPTGSSCPGEMARDFLAAGAPHPVARIGSRSQLKPGESPGRRHLTSLELKPPRKKDGPARHRPGHRVHRAHRPRRRRESRDLRGCSAWSPTCLDPEEHPALDLACCYPERWGCRDRHRPPQNRHGRRTACPPQQGPRRSPAGNVGAFRRLPGTMQDHRDRCRRRGHTAAVPGSDLFPHALARSPPRGHRRGFFPLTSRNSPSPRSC